MEAPLHAPPSEAAQAARDRRAHGRQVVRRVTAWAVAGATGATALVTAGLAGWLPADASTPTRTAPGVGVDPSARSTPPGGTGSAGGASSAGAAAGSAGLAGQDDSVMPWDGGAVTTSRQSPRVTSGGS